MRLDNIFPRDQNIDEENLNVSQILNLLVVKKVNKVILCIYELSMLDNNSNNVQSEHNDL